MTPPVWFFVQLGLAGLALVIAAVVGRRWARGAVWMIAAALAVLVVWPLMRFFPVQPIRWLGASTVACVELTGLFVPAVLVFALAAMRVPRKSDARGLRLLIVICAVYFVRAGWWMVSSGVPDLGPTRMTDGVCRQTTSYTCAAASLVTLLAAHGIEATETEMARLSMTEVNGGTTDSRSVWALEKKVKDRGFSVRYEVADLAGLIAAPKPCAVQLDWAFFVSHMVPVMAADADKVRLGDPLEGVREVSAAEFMREWKGRLISVVRAESASGR
jgi:predicted double-glycine peptidase